MMEDVVRVFLCEDDENLGPLLSEFLNTKGYQTDLFQDGQAGWEGLRSAQRVAELLGAAAEC